MSGILVKTFEIQFIASSVRISEQNFNLKLFIVGMVCDIDKKNLAITMGT